MKRKSFSLAMAIVFSGLHAQAQAALTVFADKAAFFLATGATSATGPLPLLGYVSSARVGSITISNTSGSSDPSTSLVFGIFGQPNAEDFWTPLLPGIDLAVSGFEDLNFILDTPTVSFGFDFAEHMTMRSGDGLCGIASGCVDSTFTVSLLLGSSPVDSFTFNAPNDVASFVGVWSTEVFDRVEIRESRTQGGVENDYFGQFYTGPTGCAVTSGGVPILEQVTNFGSCPPGLFGSNNPTWGRFGKKPGGVLEADSGEKLELKCEQGFFKLFYTPPGGSPMRVGVCPYDGGCNTVLFQHSGDNNNDGKPDCFLTTHWISRDYNVNDAGRIDLQANVQPDLWTEELNENPPLLDWASSVFSV